MLARELQQPRFAGGNVHGDRECWFRLRGALAARTLARKSVRRGNRALRVRPGDQKPAIDQEIRQDDCGYNHRFRGFGQKPTRIHSVQVATFGFWRHVGQGVSPVSLGRSQSQAGKIPSPD